MFYNADRIAKHFFPGYASRGHREASPEVTSQMSLSGSQQEGEESGLVSAYLLCPQPLAPAMSVPGLQMGKWSLESIHPNAFELTGKSPPLSFTPNPNGHSHRIVCETPPLSGP